MRKPCIEPDCPNLTTNGPRCPAHTRQRDQARGSRQARGYDHNHEAERKKKLTPTASCYWCGNPATHLDHEPPLKTLRLTVPRDDWHLYTVPACQPCNLRRAGNT